MARRWAISGTLLLVIAIGVKLNFSQALLQIDKQPQQWSMVLNWANIPIGLGIICWLVAAWLTWRQ